MGVEYLHHAQSGNYTRKRKLGYEYTFLDRQSWFREIMDIERGYQPRKRESNEVISIPLDSEDDEHQNLKKMKMKKQFH